MYMGVLDNYKQDACTYGMCRTSFVVVSLVINVTPNFTSVCTLLKGLHIAYYVRA